jgi:hypothetical protein
MSTGGAAGPDESGRAVFIQDFADISRPLGEVRALAGIGPSQGEGAVGGTSDDVAWLAALATAAEEDGESLLLRLGPAWAAGHLSRRVRLRLGAVRERGDGLAYSIRWEAAEHPSLFPVLEGDLELAPLGPDQCRLVLYASYVPPLGELGRRLDRALLHRVAESTARSFLRRLASTLERPR